MEQVQKRTAEQRQRDLKNKQAGRSVDSKEWWSLIKQQQGVTGEDAIPPLTKPGGSAAIDNKDRAEMLPNNFANKMTILNPDYYYSTLS